MASSATSDLSQSIRIVNDYPTRAVILAAGLGRRLEPLTKTVPKPLLVVDGRPTLSWTLEALKTARVTDACVVVNHLAGQIIDYIDNYPELGMTIRYCHQRHNLGTADALLSASCCLDRPVFVLASDYALPKHFLIELKREYLVSAAEIVVSLKQIPASEIKHRSLVQTDKSGAISEILEKPSHRTSSNPIGASLIYILPQEVKHYLNQVSMSARGEFDLPEVLDLMIKAGFAARGLLQKAPKEWSQV